MKTSLKIAIVTVFALCCTALALQAKSPHRSSSSTSGVVREISLSQYKKLIANWSSAPYKYKRKRPAVVDVYASWCGPCKRLSPTMDRLAKMYKGKVDFYRIDGDKYPEIMRAYDFHSFPTVIFWSSSGFMSSQKGACSEDFYINEINNLIY